MPHFSCALLAVSLTSVCAENAARAAADITPAIQSAIRELSAEDFGTRRKALTKLESALADQAFGIAAVDDPEGSGQLIQALEFNEGLTRWLIEWEKFPQEQRNAELAVVSRPELLPILVKIFGTDPAQRADAVKDIDKSNVVGIEAFLAHLVHHGDRGVALAAMAALWDRKPTTAVADALWYRAVPASLEAENWHEIYKEDAYSFRGRPIAGTVAGRGHEIMDGDVAAEVLIHLHEVDPATTAFLAEKIRSLLNDAAAAAGRYQTTAAPNDQWFTRDAMTNIYRLAEAYKPEKISEFLHVIATSSAAAAPPRTIGMGNDPTGWSKVSTRLSAAASLLIVNGEDPQKLGLHLVQGWNLWGIPAGAKESDVVDALEKWWPQHKAN